MDELLSAYDVSKAYRARDGVFQALDHVTLTVGKGEIVGLVGTSGSGKSTIASIVCGLETADEGRLCFCGHVCDVSTRWSRRPQGYKDAAKRLQMVFQNPYGSLNPYKKIGWIIEEPLRVLKKYDSKERKTKMLELLDKVGLVAL